ncbi:TspO/MBR family protein [Candidatus Cytomitobacter indipagum]|nr:TspO/MBR family protein [Candidatus Cytomitobacter indipagum]
MLCNIFTPIHEAIIHISRIVERSFDFHMFKYLYKMGISSIKHNIYTAIYIAIVIAFAMILSHCTYQLYNLISLGKITGRWTKAFLYIMNFNVYIRLLTTLLVAFIYEKNEADKMVHITMGLTYSFSILKRAALYTALMFHIRFTQIMHYMLSLNVAFAILNPKNHILFSYFTYSKYETWNNSLIKSSLHLSSNIFELMWIISYCILGYIWWHISNKNSMSKTIFNIHIILNLAWYPIFCILQRPGISLMHITLLITSALYMMISLRKAKHILIILIPYIALLMTEAYLNLYIFLNN